MMGGMLAWTMSQEDQQIKNFNLMYITSSYLQMVLDIRPTDLDNVEADY